MATPTWSLITVTFNSARTLTEYWRSFPTAPSTEWIVVDNHSSDDSVATAKALGARVISLNSNLGFGAANNIGFRESNGDFVAFVNPDVRVDVTDLPRLEHELTKDPRSLVAPQLVNHDGSLQPNGRGLPYLINKVRNRTTPDELLGSYLHFAEHGQIVPVDWLMGAVVAGRRAHLADLGPWDERFFVYYEDSDLGLRNARIGGTSKILGDARWQHGWARETTAPSLSAWRRELPSMMKFYSRYPRLLGRPRTRSQGGRP